MQAKPRDPESRFSACTSGQSFAGEHATQLLYVSVLSLVNNADNGEAHSVVGSKWNLEVSVVVWWLKSTQLSMTVHRHYSRYEPSVSFYPWPIIVVLIFILIVSQPRHI